MYAHTPVSTEQLLAEYRTGTMSPTMLAEKYGWCPNTIYHRLRDAGCVFDRRRKKPVTEEERAARSDRAKKRTWVMPPEVREKISLARKCHYDGLNGYGHTKVHCRGYILAYAPDHPHAHADGYVMLHTIIVERSLGRYLTEDETVHHINHDRSDNRLENLALMNKHEHASMHMRERHEQRRKNICCQ